MINRFQQLTKRPRLVATAAGLATLVILLSHYAVKYGLNTPPSISGDELSYDSIGWNLAQGGGYAEGSDDPMFWRPYVEAGELTLDQAAARAQSPPESVAHRPPLFPGLLSALNQCFGRQFWSVRVVNVLATAGTCGLLVWYLLRTGNVVGAIGGFVLFLFADTRTRLYGRALVTEATATCLLTIVTVLLLQLSGQWRRRTVILLGITCGLLVLDRTVFALWLPGLAVIVGWLGCQTISETADAASPSRRKRFLLSAAGFLVVSVLVVLPWSIRNVRVLHAMMPLGTQGMSQLPAGFSDHALERQGVWDMEPTHRLEREVAHYPARLERDVARARLGRQESFSWIRANPGDALQLGGMKIWQEYRPRTRTEWLICIAATLGLLFSLRRPDTRLFVALHVISCLVIAATWSVEGRFVMPLMFTTHVFAARLIALPFGDRAVLE